MSSARHERIVPRWLPDGGLLPVLAGQCQLGQFPGKGTSEECRGDHEHPGGVRPDGVDAGRGRARRLPASHRSPLRAGERGRTAGAGDGCAQAGRGRRVPAEAGGARRAEQGQDPRRRGAREDHRDGLYGIGADHAAGGGPAEEVLALGAAQGLPALDPRAGDVGAVRLRRRAGGGRFGDGAVLPVAGLVEVPGRAAAAGQDPGVGLGGRRRRAAPDRRGSRLPADRQREDGHGRARGRDSGAGTRVRWSSAAITG